MYSEKVVGVKFFLNPKLWQGKDKKAVHLLNAALRHAAQSCLASPEFNKTRGRDGTLIVSLFFGEKAPVVRPSIQPELAEMVQKMKGREIGTNND